MTDETEIDVTDVHDVFVTDGEVMIPNWDSFAAKFPCLALTIRDGQVFLLTEDSKGKFIAIDELAKRPGRLKVAT